MRKPRKRALRAARTVRPRASRDDIDDFEPPYDYDRPPTLAERIRQWADRIWPRTSEPTATEVEEPEPHSETAVGLSEKVFGEYRNWVQSVAESLREHKRTLADERDMLRKAKADADFDAKSYLDLAAELEETRDQTRESALEIARLREMLAAKNEEIEGLQAQLTSDLGELQQVREELQQVREKLIAERHMLDEQRATLEREKSDLEKALQEVAGELQGLSFQREELNRCRRELQDALLAFRNAREAFHAELKVSTWSRESI